MIYVRRIISTLQGGVDIELGPKTLLVGPNASGKSRIRRSVELALTGCASDVAGRDEVAKGIELLQLATPGEHLKAQALLSDGTEAAYLLKRVTSGKKGSKTSSSAEEPVRPPSVDVETVLPLRRLYDSILGKPETARKFFLSHTVREISRADVLSRLPEVLKGMYEKAVQASGILVVRPEIDKLLAAMEVASKRAGESTREANAAKKTANDSGQGLPPPPTEADYTAARTAVTAARSALETAVATYQQQSQATDLQNRATNLEAQLAAAQQRLATAQAQLQYIEAEVAKLPTVEQARAAVPQMPALVKATIDALLAHAATPPEACGVCGGSQPPGHFAARAELAQAELTRHAGATAQAQATLDWTIKAHAKADEMLTGARFEVQQAQSAIEVHSATLDQVRSMLQAAGGATATGGTLTIENARTALAQAEERLRQLDAANSAWESTKKLRDGAVSAESESSRWGQLNEACGVIVRDLLDAGVAAFCGRVQAYLPTTDRFGLRLRDGGREVCQFGLVKGDALYTVLSGAEWARTTAALAAVCGPSSEDRLAVVCPEERAFDPDTLTAVLQALGKIPQQVIFESPVRPKLIPVGWTVVETGVSAGPPRMAELEAPPPAAPPPTAKVHQLGR